MAGLFYSLQEACEKLNKTETELKEIVKKGKLREFRDGPNVLFKVDELEALAAYEGVPLKMEDLEQPPKPEQPTEPAEAMAIEPEQPPEAEEAPEMEKVPEEEISLAPETAVPVEEEGGLTEADTTLTSEGINVLGETDKDYQLTEDTMAETIDASELTGTSSRTGTRSESSLEEIEEDVNLDTFGSGSGLLDLSLQADDTSLGGILDEIYTAEGSEAPEEPAGPGSAVEMVAEAEQILPEDELAAPEISVTAQSYIESAPDVQSNTLGMLLFLPLAALLYTAVVAVAGQRGVMPSILAAIQGVIWYIAIGAIVVAGLVVGAAFWLSGSQGTSLKKSPKPKKPKKEKTKKATSPETAA